MEMAGEFIDRLVHEVEVSPREVITYNLPRRGATSPRLATLWTRLFMDGGRALEDVAKLKRNHNAPHIFN